MPIATGTTRADLIATAKAWLEGRRHRKVIRLVERLILAYELEIDIRPLAAKLLRCNQQDVNFELGVRMMIHSETAALNEDRVNQTRSADPLSLAAMIESWQAKSDAEIASAQHASVYGAALAYGQIQRLSGLF